MPIGETKRPVQFDSNSNDIADSNVSLTYNFEDINKMKVKKIDDGPRQFKGIIFLIEKWKEETKPVLEFNGKSFKLKSLIFTRKCDDSTNGSMSYEYSMVIELCNNINDDLKLHIVLPIVHSDNDEEQKPSDIKSLIENTDNAKKANNKNVYVDTGINLNALIPAKGYHYYYLNNDIYMICDSENRITLNMNPGHLDFGFNEDLVLTETEAHNIFYSKSAPLNRVMRKAIYDDIYIDCAPIEDASNNHMIIKQKNVYSVRPLFDTDELGVNSKYFIMFFVSLFIFGLCYFVVKNLPKLPSDMTTINRESLLKNATNMASNSSSKITPFFYMATFIMGTFMLGKKSYLPWFKSNKAILYSLAGVFAIISYGLTYLMINTIGDKSNIPVTILMNLFVIIATVYVVCYGMIPDTLRPSHGDIWLYIIFVFPVIIGLYLTVSGAKGP